MKGRAFQEMNGISWKCQQIHPFFISRDRQVALHNHPLWKKSKYKLLFQSIGPLGRCFLELQMSICLSVCVSVCVSICSLLRYRLNVFLPPLSEVGCPIFLEIQNPLGKIMERSGLRFEHFSLEMFLNTPKKNSGWICLTKNWWKPRFPMD